MFVGNLYLKSRPLPVAFFFTSHESAMKAGIQAEGSVVVSIVDDYGQHGRFQGSDACGWLVVDVAQFIAGDIEKQQLAMRVQQRFQSAPINSSKLSVVLPAGEA